MESHARPRKEVLDGSKPNVVGTMAAMLLRRFGPEAITVATAQARNAAGIVAVAQWTAIEARLSEFAAPHAFESTGASGR